MSTEFPKPDYPVILTRKDWDKKKGVIAKMHGETKIGAEMDKVQAAYNSVDWDKINMFAHRMDWRTVTKKGWDKVMDDAKNEVTGNLAKFSQSLFALRDLSKKVAADFHKSKTIPPSDAKHVDEIAKAADELGVKMNKNSMSDILKNMYDEYQEHIEKNFIQTFYSGLKKYLGQHSGTIGQLRGDPTPKNFNQLGRDCARDLATAVGNISKANTKGFESKNPAVAQKLFDILTPWANSQSGTFKEGAKPEEVLAEVDKLEKAFKATQLYAQSLP